MPKKTNYLPEKGDIVWLDFDPTAKGEIGKRRPALVISPAQYNKVFKTCIVLPITTQLRGHNFEIKVNGLDKTSAILPIMPRTVSYTQRNIDFIKKGSKQELSQSISYLSSIIND